MQVIKVCLLADNEYPMNPWGRILEWRKEAVICFSRVRWGIYWDRWYYTKRRGSWFLGHGYRQEGNVLWEWGGHFSWLFLLCSQWNWREGHQLSMTMGKRWWKLREKVVWQSCLSKRMHGIHKYGRPQLGYHVNSVSVLVHKSGCNKVKAGKGVEGVNKEW